MNDPRGSAAYDDGYRQPIVVVGAGARMVAYALNTFWAANLLWLVAVPSADLICPAPKTLLSPKFPTFLTPPSLAAPRTKLFGYNRTIRLRPVIALQCHNSGQEDPMVWRPPTRGEGRSGAPARGAPPPRARSSQDDNKLPSWANNNNGGGGGPPARGNAAGPSGRAGSAPRRPTGRRGVAGVGHA